MASFPASKYARYKRATAFFLDWLLRARGRGRHAGKRVDLATLDAVVHEVATSPCTLTPTLLQQLPKALGACQCAITLRAHAAAFFDDQERGHAHFLRLLRRWLHALQTLQVDAPVDAEVRRFRSYYEALQVDEDYFPDEESVAQDSKKARAERRRLLDEAFAQDLQLEVACYFTELEELVQGVFDVHEQVKQQQRSMMEATVVGTLALQMAKALTAQLQLRYPVLQRAQDLVGILVSYPSASLASDITDAVQKVRDGFDRDGTFRFVPGTLLHDFTSVWTTLTSFSAVFPPLETGTLIGLPDGYFGENYGEERTPEYVRADVSHYVVLLAQQLPHIYNMVLVKRQFMGRELEGQTGLVVDLLNLMEEYFETREVTIPLVFLCVCWMQAVAALQGDAGLGRNMSLTIKHTEDLIKVVDTALLKNPLPARVKGDSYHAILRDVREGFRASLRTNNLARANPLFAGSQMMSNHLEYLVVACGFFSSKCRAFCHLYNAFVQQGFLERISVFDEMLDIYAEIIFAKSSRSAVVHGSYNRVYLLASGCSGASIDGMYEGASLLGAYVSGRDDRDDPNMMSLTYRLMHDDTSFLKGYSSKTMLKKAADVCTKEMFESRILSRDLRTLDDDMKDVFSEMCDALDRQEIRDVLMDKAPAGMSDEVRVNRALENAVMVPLLMLVDALRPDGSLDSRLVPAKLRSTVEFDIDGEFVRQMCRKAAAVIEARFATPAQICEQKYFTFPPSPDFANREYGSVSFKAKTKNEHREKVFSDLMKLMKSNYGPLDRRDLDYLKSEIKKDPELLGMFSLSTGPSSYSDYDDLCTLFHQAAAGPARDAKLVEWMIQMGALFNQPSHCRKEPRQRELTCSRRLLPNTMAVHSAAIAGYEGIVRIILEADNLVDLNTPTFHTKETLAHLVVKNGHKSLFYCLLSFGADFRIRDGKGQRVCDLTTDRRWSQDIAATMARIEESCRLGRGRRDNSAGLEHFMMLYAERLRKSVFAQRDEEQRGTLESLEVGNSVEPKKRMKGKKGVTGKSNGHGDFASRSSTKSAVDTSAMSAVIGALLGSPGSATKNAKDSPKSTRRDAILQESIQKTTAAFARLRDSSIPAADKLEDVQRICKVIRRLDNATEVQSDPNKMIGTGVQLRIDVSFEALQVIHMIQKFYRVDQGTNADSELAPVRELCATTLDFVRFVVRTAWISLSVDRKAQASEAMGVLEKRLLKTPFGERNSSEFRKLVQMYSEERDAMGLGRTSSPDTFRHLEWYLRNTVENSKLQMTLDRMAGRPIYFKLALDSQTSDDQIVLARAVIDAIPALKDVACFGKTGWSFVYGGTSKDDVTRVRNIMMKVADRTGIQVDDQNSQFSTPAIHIGQFKFSAAGPLRSAAAA
ncbi:hypothetical protein PF008_g15552 [Phytophthora fragariae]|uniref:DUF6604 domain-containing protein n=2 Tax=Phytophthora fragariae TaxID=53985 RepID=A0A6G0RE76_9STRA|nr:hypothetical protein PF008_g15552 [Phytophthora fragariae]